MSAPPATTTPMPGPIRVTTPFLPLIAAMVAGLGFVAIWKGHAPWYGDDLHWTRVLAVMLPLFCGSIIVMRLRGMAVVRVLWALIALTLALFGWWFMPSPTGRMLAQAVMERDAIRYGYSIISPDDPDSARGLKDFSATLAADYPSLAAPLGAVEENWVRRAAASYRERFDALAPGDVAGAKALQTRVRALEEAFPGMTGELPATLDSWVNRTTAFNLAFATARAKAERLQGETRVEEAFGVARTFAVEWFEEAQFLKREAEVIAFRDDYRNRAERAGPFVPPNEIAPAPRSRETAPPPREKQ